MKLEKELYELILSK
ncbi:hypothetical protein LRB31_04910 [Borreliella burgdorferi]|nr:hypothetical protein [Borreliella burgdorferi]